MADSELDLSSLAQALEGDSWSDKVLGLVCSLHNFYSGLTQKHCVRFMLNDVQIGLVTPEVVKKLEQYPEIFYIV